MAIRNPNPEQNQPNIMPDIKVGSKQHQDMLDRSNFEKKKEIYNKLDKKILIKLLVEMERNYRILNEQRQEELKEFANKISKLQIELDNIKNKTGE